MRPLTSPPPFDPLPEEWPSYTSASLSAGFTMVCVCPGDPNLSSESLKQIKRDAQSLSYSDYERSRNQILPNFVQQVQKRNLFLELHVFLSKKKILCHLNQKERSALVHVLVQEKLEKKIFLMLINTMRKMKLEVVLMKRVQYVKLLP